MEGFIELGGRGSELDGRADDDCWVDSGDGEVWL
jgi:hypothetical protein